MENQHKYDLTNELVKLTQDNENLKRALEVEKTRRHRQETLEYIIIQVILEVEQDLETNGSDSTSLTKVIQKLGKKIYAQSETGDHSLTQTIISIYTNQLKRETCRETESKNNYNNDLEFDSITDFQDNSSMIISHVNRKLDVLQEEETGQDISELEVEPVSKTSSVVRLVGDIVDKVVLDNENLKSGSKHDKEMQTQDYYYDSEPFLKHIQDIKTTVDEKILDLRQDLLDFKSSQQQTLTQVKVDVEVLKELVHKQSQLVSHVIENTKETEKELENVKLAMKSNIQLRDTSCSPIFMEDSKEDSIHEEIAFLSLESTLDSSLKIEQLDTPVREDTPFPNKKCSRVSIFF